MSARIGQANKVILECSGAIRESPYKASKDLKWMVNLSQNTQTSGLQDNAWFRGKFWLYVYILLLEMFQLKINASINQIFINYLM